MAETSVKRDFLHVLQDGWRNGSMLCAGLDPILERIPVHLHQNSVSDTLFAFNRAIIDATADLVCAFKPNTAFYEMHGAPGFEALEQTCRYIREHYPEVALILDAKRADIGSTNTGYAAMAFDRCQSDAVTVQPYLGREALEPLMERPGRGVFVLCRTSNPGAGEFQDLLIDGEPLYIHVARAVANTWNRSGSCGLVVGATYPRELAQVRAIAGDLPLLVPGIGAQGGDANAVIEAGMLADGGGLVINASRSILFAGTGTGFAAAAREAAMEIEQSLSDARRRLLDQPDRGRQKRDIHEGGRSPELEQQTRSRRNSLHEFGSDSESKGSGSTFMA